ncbi:hypothetical protein KP509_04G081300 [Ceratopteris richardii]|uniref:Uncharacterized protein n=1 Tax=Ceratopteris richardii TaxID=49495 RepID=A0A8T2UUT7_CERRI|nr:hypothetical protein KP509_04G081300 [Ceratopteris richardii]
MKCAHERINQIWLDMKSASLSQNSLSRRIQTEHTNQS